MYSINYVCCVIYESLFVNDWQQQQCTINENNTKEITAKRRHTRKRTDYTKTYNSITVPNNCVATELKRKLSNWLSNSAMMCMRSDPNTMCFCMSLSCTIIVGSPNACMQTTNQSSNMAPIWNYNLFPYTVTKLMKRSRNVNFSN